MGMDRMRIATLKGLPTIVALVECSRKEVFGDHVSQPFQGLGIGLLFTQGSALARATLG